MDAKLQELTDKIYNEGVEKGKIEANEIILQAKTDAEKTITEAKQTAEQILNNAQKEAETLKKNTESELKLFANQCVNALKTEITNLICDKIVRESVKSATSDKEFMQKMISQIVEQWAKEGEVTINTEDADELTAYFSAKAKNLLDEGVKINNVKDIKSDFEIVSSNGGFKITFGDEEFISYFKGFIRQKLIDLLF